MTDRYFARIFFGVILADIQGRTPEMLWESQGYSCEIEWWCNINGFNPSRRIYNRRGEFLHGVHPGSQAVELYGTERRDWLRKNPLPFEAVKFGEHETGSRALAVPFSGKKFGPFDSTELDPSALVVTPEAVSMLSNFCRLFEIDGELRWHVVSG